MWQLIEFPLKNPSLEQDMYSEELFLLLAQKNAIYVTSES